MVVFYLATVAPELVIHSEYSGLFFTNPAVIIPLFLTIVIVAVVITLLIHHFRKNIMSGKYLVVHKWFHPIGEMKAIEFLEGGHF